MARPAASAYVAKPIRNLIPIRIKRAAPVSRSTGKVLVCVTEDWFALSHFKPLIRRLKLIFDEVVVVTRSSGRMAEIETLGARTIDFEYNRSSMNPAREAKTVRRLSAILTREQPSIVHLIAMKPIVIGGLAAELAKTPHVVVHMTGLGFLAISDTIKARVAKHIALAIIGRALRRRSNWLFVENPEDLAFLREGGADPANRVTMLGGAGIDPSEFPEQSETGNAPPRAAFVGRIIKSKGVGILFEASRLLEQRNVALAIDLYGDTDEGNPEAISVATLQSWHDGVRRNYRGVTRDVPGVWRQSDIFVLPALSREGMPRALLEAAASGRPSIVSDVPGCRHFVQHEIEGLIVPPGDASALADALERLATDRELRSRLGKAARAKVLSGYTVAKVEAAIEEAYARCLVPR